MEKREFQAESKRLLDLVINSIYSNKDIFLRELISNSSDAIDKIYYRALKDESMDFKKEDYYIEIRPDKEARSLKIIDTGIGMSREELINNLGTIARSGSYDFKKQELEGEQSIIGQFGLGFYSAFMVADRIEVLSRSLDQDQAYLWQSNGRDGYSISPAQKDEIGTEITLYLKEDSQEEDYSKYLDEYSLKGIIKKHSDYIRYPIKMEFKKTRPKDGDKDQHESYLAKEQVNSMVPIWRRNKKELKDEDYINFYRDKGFGFDQPIHHIHLELDGLVSFKAILYIPSQAPYDFYSRDYEKGLELYSNGILIMDKCPELLPDYFSFVRGVVDSSDLSLNISREILQKDRKLELIADNIDRKLRSELAQLMKNDRDKYEEFFKVFGANIKYGLYDNFARDRDKLKDLVILPSSKAGRLRSFKDYLDDMKEDQDYIYYASGQSEDRLGAMPQTQLLIEKGYEVLYLLSPVDEMALKFMSSYESKEFKSVTDPDLKLLSPEDDKKLEESLEEDSQLFKAIEERLGSKIVKARPSLRLKDDPVCLLAQGEISLEMEKALANLEGSEKIVADKVLEINLEHTIYSRLKEAHSQGEEKFNILVDTLYDQARLIEGLEIEDPLKFANNIWKLI